MLSSYIKQKILENAVSLNQFGMNDLTWEKESAKILITSLMQDETCPVDQPSNVLEPIFGTITHSSRITKISLQSI